jgi:hypothetical protein
MLWAMDNCRIRLYSVADNRPLGRTRVTFEMRIEKSYAEYSN